MRPPQSVWSLYAFAFGLIGAIFVFLGAIFFITRFPVSGAPDGFFLLTGASLSARQHLLPDEIPAAWAHQALENGGRPGGGEYPVCSAGHLDKLEEYKDVFQLARTMLAVGRSMLLLLWRPDLYGQKRPVLAGTGCCVSAACHLP